MTELKISFNEEIGVFRKPCLFNMKQYVAEQKINNTQTLEQYIHEVLAYSIAQQQTAQM